ncbi:hypothetical protein D3C77_502590 [compost metagenome]
MPGEVTEQYMHISGRGERRQQQVAVEQRIGRLQVADISCAQATGMGHLIEHGLGHPLLVKQVVVVTSDLITLLQDRGLQPAQAIHGLDFCGQDHWAIGFCQKVVAPSLKAAHQRLLFTE